MNKTTMLIAIALLGALLISFFSGSQSYEERLIGAGLKEVFGPNAIGFLTERPELQALFLDYSENLELALKARIAIIKYGDEARNILVMYGEEPEFQDVLSRYGENVVPIIHYFIENNPFSLYMAVQSTTEKVTGVWHSVAGQGEDQLTQDTTHSNSSYAPTDRGWHAVKKIRTQGHNFLSQFEIAPGNKAKWIQTERLLEGASAFFASGVRNLETKYAMEEQIKAADLFWAGIDAAVFVSAVKALRVVKMPQAGKAIHAGKVAGQTARAGEAIGKSGKGLSFLNRTKMFTSRLIPKSAFGRMILKGGAGVGLIYVLVKHPGVLNSVFGEIAGVLGLNTFLVQVVCWAILIFAICLPLTTIFRIFLPLIIRALSFVVMTLSQLERQYTRIKAKTLSVPIQA